MPVALTAAASNMMAMAVFISRSSLDVGRLFRPASAIIQVLPAARRVSLGRRRIDATGAEAYRPR
jgi:hypothetical protein